jgi:cysteinyl-tRNA synthetase
MSGARIEVNDVKENPLDFALWKAAKPGEPAWDSPWSKGRPGWHIECSAMSNRYLGKTIDIHCGGEDLQFPHHENEIAQSEAANGCEFVHYWMHNGFLNIDNKKMSKSLNNFFTVREAAAAYGYDTIRYFMLSAHYRSPLNYSADILGQCRSSLSRLRNAWQRMEELSKNGPQGEVKPEEQAVIDSFDTFRSRFDEAMDDDFNTANAVSVFFELVRAINVATAEKNQPTRAFAQQCLSMMDEFNQVLGLIYDAPVVGKEEEESQDTGWIEDLIAARAAAKAAKNWAEADRIRDELKEKGIILKDSKQGTTWEKA